VVILTLLPICPVRNNPCYIVTRELGRTYSRRELFGGGEKSLGFASNQKTFLRSSAHRLVTVPTAYSGFSSAMDGGQ